MHSRFLTADRWGPGLVAAVLVTYGNQMWVAAVSRKIHNCERCSARLEKGTSIYRPVTNAHNRMERICRRCMSILVGENPDA